MAYSHVFSYLKKVARGALEVQGSGGEPTKFFDYRIKQAIAQLVQISSNLPAHLNSKRIH